MKIIIKVGSQVITKPDGKLDNASLAAIVRQVTIQDRAAHQVILVSSGSISAGRSHFQTKEIDPQTLAAVGQIPLMQRYSQFFSDDDIVCGQVLVTKSDFRDRSHYLNMRNCIESLLKNGVVPIVNENDVVSLEAIRFTDNDELAGLVAAMTNADLLIILTSVDGLLDSDGTVINTVSPTETKWQKHIRDDKSVSGRGGMQTKTTVARRLANLGIKTCLVNGTKADIITKVLTNQAVGTTFLPLKRTAAAKRWLSQASGNEKATVHINEGAAAILTDPTTPASLLPVGITKIEGTFVKDDVLKVVGPNGKMIGIGKAAYEAALALKYLGHHQQKPLIHYDFLWIETEF